MSEIKEMTEEQYGQYLNHLLKQKMQNIAENVSNSQEHEWGDLYKGYIDSLETAKSNIIPKSVFEAKYSKFFNPKNLEILKTKSSSSPEVLAWQEASKEFMQEVDLYRPYTVVDDNDHTKVLQVFPAVFRAPDQFKPSKELGEQLTSIPSDENTFMTVKEVLESINDFYNNLSNCGNPAKALAAKQLMSQSLAIVQDRQVMAKDIINTDKIISQFYYNFKQMNDELNNQDTSTPINKKGDELDVSAEEYGISFE